MTEMRLCFGGAEPWCPGWGLCLAQAFIMWLRTGLVGGTE